MQQRQLAGKNVKMLLYLNAAIGVARGALGARAPQGEEKWGRRNLQGKVVSALCTPGIARVNF